MRRLRGRLARLVILAGLCMFIGAGTGVVAGNTTALAVGAVSATQSPVAPTPSLPTPSPATTGQPEEQSPQITLAIEALRSNPPLYNSPHAPLAITPSQEIEVKAAITASGTPIFVAILPRIDEPGGAAKQLFKGLDQPGTYVAILGTVYDVYSTLFDAKPLLTHAFAEQRANSTAAVLAEFSTLVGKQASGTETGPSGFPWAQVLIVTAIILIIGGLYFGLQARTAAKSSRE